MLIIIAVLTFLFAYKLTNYSAEFKTLHNKSVVEIVFLSIFFVLLFIPMSYIDKGEISKQENRALAKLNPLINQDFQINYNFPKEFDSWFNDRFNLRTQLINCYNTICYIFFEKVNRGVYDKETGFLYTSKKAEYLNMAELDDDLNTLVKFRDFLKENNIKLYVLVVPNKEDIYKSNLIDYSDNSNDEFIDFVKQANKTFNLKIIYPYQALLDGKKNNYMYFQTEHHWTNDGAYIGYLELMKEIRKDFSDIKAPDINDYDFSYNNLVKADFIKQYEYGTTVNYLNLPFAKKFHKVKYRYFKHKDYDNLEETIIDTSMQRFKFFYYPKGSNHRVILLGTSQSENLTEFVPFTFKKVFRLRNNNIKNIPVKEEFKIMKYYKKEILDYKCDILILCITYENFASLHKLLDLNN